MQCKHTIFAHIKLYYSQIRWTQNARQNKHWNKITKKTNKTNNKQHQERKRKESDTLSTHPVFPKDFSQVVYLFLS